MHVTLLNLNLDICLFELMLYIPVNNFSVLLGYFLDLTSTKQRTKCLAKGQNTVSPVSLEPAILSSNP